MTQIDVPHDRHDLSTLPGGYLLHHSFCWCKQEDNLATQVRAALSYWPEGATSRLDILQARLDRIAALLPDAGSAD